MELAAIEVGLRQELGVKSVQDLEGFPSASYSEFLTQYKAGRLQVHTKYDHSAFHVLASSGHRLMHYVLTGSPVLVSLALVLASITQWNFWLLLGVPLAFLGLLFTTPGLMRSFGYGLLLIVGGLALYSYFQGSRTTAYVLSAFAVPNFLADVARQQCDLIIRDAIGKSQIVLVWLYLRGTVVLKN